MAKRKAKREHRWSGAGYVCADCGAIKHTNEPKECPGRGELGFDVWLYHAGAGWWLHDEDLADASEASAVLRRKIGTGNTVAGAIVPAGQRLGLFTQEMRMPSAR